MKKVLQILTTTILLITNPISENFLFANHHSDYFTIVIDNPHNDDNPQVFHYPKGTTFELLSTKNKIFASSEDNREKHTYWGNFSLIIYPTYRADQPDKIKIRQQRVRIFDVASKAKEAGFFYKKTPPTTVKSNEIEQTNTHQYISNGVSISKKTLTKSTVYDDELNVELTFSDGVIFKYIDGKATAQQNDKNLVIANKYFIYSDFGVTKLSYNSKTGKIWWVYEPTKL